jgi:hypothetical protein
VLQEQAGTGSHDTGGAGGDGTASSISGSSVTYAGGGGGADLSLLGGAGGTGGGGGGKWYYRPSLSWLEQLTQGVAVEVVSSTMDLLAVEQVVQVLLLLMNQQLITLGIKLLGFKTSI